MNTDKNILKISEYPFDQCHQCSNGVISVLIKISEYPCLRLFVAEAGWEGVLSAAFVFKNVIRVRMVSSMIESRASELSTNRCT